MTKKQKKAALLKAAERIYMPSESDPGTGGGTFERFSCSTVEFYGSMPLREEYAEAYGFDSDFPARFDDDAFFNTAITAHSQLARQLAILFYREQL